MLYQSVPAISDFTAFFDGGRNPCTTLYHTVPSRPVPIPVPIWDSRLVAQLMHLAMTFPAQHDAIKQRRIRAALMEFERMPCLPQ